MATASKLRGVMIVGSRLLQQSLAALYRYAGVTIAGACGVAEAVTMAGELFPEVVVMELPGRGRAALSCLPALVKLRPAPRVILVCRDSSRAEITAALELGIDGCVSEDGGGDQLVEAFDAVRRSQRYVDPIVSDILQRRPGGQSAGFEEHGAAELGLTLTPREREVLARLAQGETGPQIAKQLGMSPKTVHTHRTRLMNKLGVHNVGALIGRAIRLGLADL